ncbi:Rho termination factor N-terminal domain-containing protein [Actinoplanes sp. NPDC023936]|uniref:Rho termination factor N-terminal domain-containing protein n=1 Tax=Actinoplanes sp. NPDC023936 TaxID=3154910 RepID=UPI0033EE899F
MSAASGPDHCGGPAAGDGDRRALVEEIHARLGAAFELIRLDELNPGGYEQAAESLPPRTGDLAEATRDELYRKAQKADIPGRSHMNKDQLIEALREQD